MYSGKNYNILSLLEDPHLGNNWYSEQSFVINHRV